MLADLVPIAVELVDQNGWGQRRLIAVAVPVPSWLLVHRLDVDALQGAAAARAAEQDRHIFFATVGVAEFDQPRWDVLTVFVIAKVVDDVSRNAVVRDGYGRSWHAREITGADPCAVGSSIPYLGTDEPQMRKRQRRPDQREEHEDQFGEANR